MILTVNGVQIEPTSLYGGNEMLRGARRDVIRITFAGTVDQAKALFRDGVPWSVTESGERPEVTGVNEDGTEKIEMVQYSETFNYSDHSVAGDVIDHRDGMVTVLMGEETEAEQLTAVVSILTGEED